MVDHIGQHITFVNVRVICRFPATVREPPLRRSSPQMSASWPPRDILAIDQASVDLVYAMKEEDHKDLVERIESRHGLRQLSYMKELQMGNDRYQLIDIDNGRRCHLPKGCGQGRRPF